MGLILWRNELKKILIVSSLAIVAVAANAQSFTESFDSGPAGFSDGTNITFGNSGGQSMAFASGTWYAHNASTPVGTTGWFSNNSVFAPNSGSGQLNANYNNVAGNNTINNFMMSMQRTFNNGDTISFYTRTVDSVAFPDRLRLLLSTNGASTNIADFSTVLLSVNEGLTTTGYPSTWTQFTATISGLGGATAGRFAFNYNVPSGGPSGANSDFIGIDDVAYTAVPEPATMAVLGLGVAAMARRRRNRS